MKLLLTLCLTFALSRASPAATKISSDNFINAINRQQSTWTAGRNFPLNTPFEQLKVLAGTLPEPEEYKKTKTLKVHNVSPFDIPESFDAREQWPNCASIREIRNQGSCGSCWSFGAAEAMSDRICIHSNGAVNFEVSPEDILECCTGCGYGCQGGWPALAFDYWVNEGITSGGDADSHIGCKPYKNEAFSQGQTPACARACEDDENYDSSKKYGASSYYFSLDIQQIQTEIMTNGPVEVTFHVYEDFYNYQTGVYQYVAGNYVGDHAVKVLGWGVENGTPYWLAANSWGQWGGLGGYFKMLRGQNHMDFELTVDAGLPRF